MKVDGRGGGRTHLSPIPIIYLVTGGQLDANMNQAESSINAPSSSLPPILPPFRGPASPSPLHLHPLLSSPLLTFRPPHLIDTSLCSNLDLLNMFQSRYDRTLDTFDNTSLSSANLSFKLRPPLGPVWG